MAGFHDSQRHKYEYKHEQKDNGIRKRNALVLLTLSLLGISISGRRTNNSVFLCLFSFLVRTRCLYGCGYAQWIPALMILSRNLNFFRKCHRVAALSVFTFYVLLFVILSIFRLFFLCSRINRNPWACYDGLNLSHHQLAVIYIKFTLMVALCCKICRWLLAFKAWGPFNWNSLFRSTFSNDATIIFDNTICSDCGLGFENSSNCALITSI